MSFVPEFLIGDVVTFKELRTSFQCGSGGGMLRSGYTNTLVIISDYTKTLL